MANGYGYPTNVGPKACATAVDAATGPYPKPGVNKGGGRHVPAAKSATTTYCAPITVGLSVYYVADAITIPILTPLSVPLGLPAPGPIPFVKTIGVV